MILDRITRLPLAAILLALAMAIVVGSALGFEHIGGYVPCALCLKERIPYYLGIPVALFAAVAATSRWPDYLARLAMAALMALMAWSLYLAVYHSGVEWGFWPGPETCGGGGGLATSTDNLLSALNRQKPPSCDQAAGRFLGLSFAGWNMVTSLGLLAVILISLKAWPIAPASSDHGSSSLSQ